MERLSKRTDDGLRKRDIPLPCAVRGETCDPSASLQNGRSPRVEAETVQKKKDLRWEYLKRQSALPGDYVKAASDSIQAQVLSSAQYTEAKSLFVYRSTEKEPSTERISRRALADGKHVYLPKCAKRRDMLAVRIQSLEDLVPGALGIMEPSDSSETASAAELDLILVPCVSASVDGRRLGHGAGYYDRFLSGHSERAVCLCFSRMLCSEIPMDSHDVYIPQVISEVLP